MNRRQVMLLSGAALAVRESAQAQTTTQGASANIIKTLIRYNRARTSYKIPKSETKTTQYVGSLSAALELSIGQQQEATRIFNAASATRSTLRSQYKTARQSLRDAIYGNDTNATGQAISALGTAKGQLIAAGATAHAAFYQLLSAPQREKLLQYRS